MKFQVQLRETLVTTRYVTVEATNEDEAWDIADDKYTVEITTRQAPTEYTTVEILDVIEDSTHDPKNNLRSRRL